MGSLMLMDDIVELLPNPVEGNYAQGHAPPAATRRSTQSPPAAYPAPSCSRRSPTSTASTPIIKVISGTITSDLALVNARTGNTEKLGRLYTMRGKKAVEVKELSCGDIGAIGKMEKVKTGDTLCDARKVVALKQPIPFAEPCYSVAIVPKTRGQEDKIAQGLARLNEEDPTFYRGEQRRDPPDGPQRRRRHADGRAGVQAEEPLQCGGGAEGPPGGLS